MKRFAIQETKRRGCWWTGECWGGEKNRKTYDQIEDLPQMIDGLTVVWGKQIGYEGNCWGVFEARVVEV